MHRRMGSPDPVSAGFEVILSVDDEPVLNRVGANSEYRTVCWMLRCPR
jgi:hypothetical protein